MNESHMASEILRSTIWYPIVKTNIYIYIYIYILHVYILQKQWNADTAFTSDNITYEQCQRHVKKEN